MLRWSPLAAVAAAAFLAPPPLPAQPPAVRVGVVAGALGSFAANILPALEVPFQRISDKTPGDSLAAYDLLVVDNLFQLKALNGPAFRNFVERGGVLLILNPKADGFSRVWSPYDVFIGEPTREGRIVDRKHPIFTGFPDDKIQDLADSNGPFVANCSFTEPAREWRVLARHKDRKKNPLVLEAGFGRGHIILACLRFDHYNARAGATRLGDNLFRYALTISERLRRGASLDGSSDRRDI